MNFKINLFRRRGLIKRALIFLAVSVSLVIFGEQCTKVDISAIPNYGFALSATPFQLQAPSLYPEIRRYIILVDMSHSMISGPCPQDIDAGLLFKPMPLYTPYDPNKNVGNPNDHRADGSDCQVNPTLAINQSSITTSPPNINGTPPTFYQTTLGTDYEGDRFTIVQNWINQITQNSTPLTLQNTEILLYPFSGGQAQQLIMSNYPIQMQFYAANDPALTTALTYLKAVHSANLTLSESSFVYRYQNTSMGTSSPGPALPSLYTIINKDMQALDTQGNLTFSDYRIIHLSDGMWNDTSAQVQSVLNIFPLCSACAADPTTCADTCSQLVQNMTTGWGDPSTQGLQQLNFNYGLIQQLPNFYGSGLITLDFVNLKPERTTALYPGDQSFYQQLLPLFQAAKRTANMWVAEGSQPPFDASLGSSDTVTFKLTNLYVLNTNAHQDVNGNILADSDGDGVPDIVEIQNGTDPTKARTDGVCLDSIAINPAFSAQCAALAVSRNCDPTLDSDGDGLNQCEEMILGTNPFGFDTDGDAMPDFLEWIYGYNPLVSDVNLDSNSDGIPNPINFAHGLPPMAMFQKLSDMLMIPDYAVNYLGKAQVLDPVYGSIWLDQYHVIINRIPTVATLPVSEANQVQLYAASATADPSGAAANKIPAGQQLISYTDQPGSNEILVLARLVDINHPQRIHWEIYKTAIPVGTQLEQTTIDISKLQEFRTIDINNSVTGN